MTYIPPSAPNGPQSDADALAGLVASRNSLIQEIALVEAAQATAGGATATYTLGDQTVDWNTWYTAKMEQLDKLNLMIQKLDPPWEIQVHGWM